MVQGCVACMGMLGVGCSIASFIWWGVDLGHYQYSYVVAAMTCSAVAAAWALGGMCFATCIEGCIPCCGKLSSAGCFLVASVIQACTAVILNSKPKCVFSNCEIGGATVVSFTAAALYFASSAAACFIPSPSNKRDEEEG
ncbi:expressed unknown protein [Seminavis robusta]|uniref:Uncharacterized protein n=1 Tax=Seminavis robusta TaxID=568900 RepID=A0A9N8HR68_9STRA|nr:expressed unknown protein [Seminavis robusta]|eukprot:Sro1050_g235480.1 n/a (140) ;mRNA; f:7339-7892